MSGDSPLEEDPRIEANQPPSTIRGGALGTLAALQARPQKGDGEGTSSRRPAGRLAPPADPAPGAASRLVVLKAGGEGEARGGCLSGGPVALTEGTLGNQPSEREAAHKE